MPLIWCYIFLLYCTISSCKISSSHVVSLSSLTLSNLYFVRWLLRFAPRAHHFGWPCAACIPIKLRHLAHLYFFSLKSNRFIESRRVGDLVQGCLDNSLFASFTILSLDRERKNHDELVSIVLRCRRRRKCFGHSICHRSTKLKTSTFSIWSILYSLRVRQMQTNFNSKWFKRLKFCTFSHGMFSLSLFQSFGASFKYQLARTAWIDSTNELKTLTAVYLYLGAHNQSSIIVAIKIPNLTEHIQHTKPKWPERIPNKQTGDEAREKKKTVWKNVNRFGFVDFRSMKL